MDTVECFNCGIDYDERHFKCPDCNHQKPIILRRMQPSLTREQIFIDEAAILEEQYMYNPNTGTTYTVTSTTSNTTITLPPTSTAYSGIFTINNFGSDNIIIS